MNDLGDEIAAALLGMLVFGGLVALLVLGLRRQAPGARGVAAWYIQSAIGVSAALALGGIAEMITAVIGYIHQSSAYAGGNLGGGIIGLGSGEGGVTTSQSMELDLINGLVVIVIGLLMAWVHLMLARRAALPVLGALGWAWWASPAITLVLFGLVGVTAFLSFLGTVITNVVTSVDQPWGSDLALAVVFVPAWAWLAIRLFASMTKGEPVADPAPAAVA